MQISVIFTPNHASATGTAILRASNVRIFSLLFTNKQSAA